jgi:hypothetical protein
MFTHLLLTTFILAASDARLLTAEKRLDEKDCDGLYDVFESYKGSKSGGEKDIAYARVLVRGSNLCRAKDKVIALAMTEKALAYAGKDYGVQTAHAENLIALDQRSDAATLLDQTIQDHPEGAVRARYLRGQLADEENEPAIAVQVLKPLAEDTEYGEKVAPIIARNEEKLLKHSEAKAELKNDEERLKAGMQKANEIATARGELTAGQGGQKFGSEVWGVRGSVKSGGSRTFNTKNVKAGTTYVLNVTGTCKVPKTTSTSSSSSSKKKNKAFFERKPDLFSIDFRAKVGSNDPVSLKVGEQPERNQVTFRALEDNPQLLIEDRGASLKGVSCTVSDISIRVP